MTDAPINEYELARLNAVRMSIDQVIDGGTWAVLSSSDRVFVVTEWLCTDRHGQYDPLEVTKALQSPTVLAVVDQLIAEAHERNGYRDA